MRVMRNLAVALATLATVSTATLPAAEAGPRERNFVGGVIAGVAGAAIVGGIARSHGRYHAPGYYEPSYAPGYHVEPRYVYAEPVHVAPRRAARVHKARQAGAHVGWCSARYRSYDSGSNTFQPNHGPRRACVSPYL